MILHAQNHLKEKEGKKNKKKKKKKKTTTNKQTNKKLAIQIKVRILKV